MVVHDLARAAAENLLAEGAGWADSPRAAATGAEVVMTSLPSPTAVEAVMAGPEGALAGLAAGAAWIDLTTNDQAVLKRLAARAAEAGVATLDAPVTGGVLRARRGALTVLVGGEAAVFAAHRPLLEAIGTEVIHLGPLGDATVAKLITNQLCFIHTVALGEGLMLGAKAGLALGPLWEAIKASYGNSFVAEVDGPPILHGDRTVVFALALAAKDLRLTMELGRALGRAARADRAGGADHHPRPGHLWRGRQLARRGAPDRGRDRHAVARARGGGTGRVETGPTSHLAAAGPSRHPDGTHPVVREGTMAEGGVGQIGLGALGIHFAERLNAARGGLRVLDLDAAKVAHARAFGAVAARSPKHLAARSATVLLSLPSPAAVKTVMLGRTGILAGAAPETLVIDTSTVDPATSREVHRVAAKRKVRYLDAPVL